MTRSLLESRSTRNAPSGTGSRGGVGALFCPERGGGGPVRKIPDGGTGGIQEYGGGVGTPTPSCDHPTPLVRDRRGSPPSPARRTFHAKCRFWNWKHRGVVPSFLPDKGGGGLFEKKENRGEGGGNNFGGHPPWPDYVGWGGGSWAGIFLRIAGSGPEVFEKSLATGLCFFENPEQLNHGFSKILSNATAVFRKSAAPGPGIFREKPQIPNKLRRMAAMIICGLDILGRVRCRSFLIITDTCIEVFQKSSATRLNFFEKPPQPNQGFGKFAAA